MCLLREDIKDLVEKLWNITSLGGSSIELLQDKISKHGKTTEGCSANTQVELRKLKKILMEDYDKLVIKSEIVEIFGARINRMKEIHL